MRRVALLVSLLVACTPVPIDAVRAEHSAIYGCPAAHVTVVDRTGAGRYFAARGCGAGAWYEVVPYYPRRGLPSEYVTREQSWSEDRPR